MAANKRLFFKYPHKSLSMKFRILLLCFSCFMCKAFSQDRQSSSQKEIKQVMKTFMNCIIHKDSNTFYSLFHNEPVVWAGVFRDATQANRLKRDSTKKDHFSGDYKSFYRSIADDGSEEEKFYNIQICTDGNIASVTFDYSYWEKKIKVNWGKESWGLVRTNNQWKITSVIFSYESEAINKEKAHH